MMRFLKRKFDGAGILIYGMWSGAAGLFIIILTANLIPWWVTRNRLFDDVDKVPANEFAMVLGTSKLDFGGKASPYYFNRIRAALELYKAGKVKYLLVSGAKTRTGFYDETRDMRGDLIHMGVPAGKIFSDGAGFRTLDSVIRAKRIYGFEKLTIISQDSHNVRALYIADYYRLEAVAFNASGTGNFSYRARYAVRECLAKVKMMLDLYILHTMPAELGNSIKLLAIQKS